MRSIRDFLAGRAVLLTGGTGFLGKALQEKLLRDVPGLARLFVLVRPRRRPDGTLLTAEERLRREVYETSIFARLRQHHGERFASFLADKVVAVPGDLTEDGLGIPPEVVARLRAEVEVVIHGAASVTFDERIDHAVEMNALGPRRLVELARSFARPPFFAFVSTAYVSGARRGPIPEEPPRLGFDLDAELRAIAAFTRDLQAAADGPEARERFRAAAERARAAGQADPGLGLEALAAAGRERWVERRLVREGMRRARRLGWHDVYTFTKAMGEALVVRHRGELPIALVRPSIIESSLRDPEPGWINGLKVADPLIAGYAKGKIPDFPGRREAVLDLIPVDYVANAVLAALARLEAEPGLAVYHVASGGANPIRVGEVYRLIQAYYRMHPARDRRGEPVRARDWGFPSPAWFKLRWRLFGLWPLRLLRAAVRALPFLPWPDRLGEKLGKGVEGLERLLYYTDIYGPYTSLACTFQSERTRALFAALSPSDQETFPFDVRAISWPHYLQEVHLSGLDRHVLRFGRPEGKGPRVTTEDLRTIPDLLRLSAERFRDKVALQVKRDGAWARVTHAELYRRAGELGARWRSEGLRRGDRVLLMADNMPEWAIAYMGAVAAGATVVPIDVHTPSFEVEAIVDFTEARAVLTTPALHPGLPKAVRSARLPVWDITRGGQPFEGRPAGPAPPPGAVHWEELSPDDVASVIFTSGPLVEPRGVQLTHRNFLANLLSLSEVLRSYETDRFVSLLPLHHALEFTGGLLMPIFSGATVTYAPSLKSRVVLELMAETGATAVLAVPRLYEMLLDRLRRGGGDGEGGGAGEGEKNPLLTAFVNRTRLLVSGGAPLDYSIYEAYAAIGTPIHEGYGLTETAPILTVNPLWAIRPRSVGKALPGVELRIDRPDPTGEGEIVVRGPNVMKGYLKNPVTTARVLKDGWLYTGDLGRLDGDGYLTITGRSKELIVTGAGKNVWPEEVELFYRELEGVDEIAVFGVREPGATRETVHAAVRTSGDREAVLESIHRVSHERPSYQRIQFVHFWDGPIPRLPGERERPDSRALRLAVIERARTAKKEKPRAAVKDAEAPWWSRTTLDLIGRIAGREDPVMPRESLAQLLDSLQQVELLAALEGRFGVTIPDEEAASLRTVADVLARVKQAAAGRSEPGPEAPGEPAAGDYWSRALAGAGAAAGSAMVEGDEAGLPPGLERSPAAAPLQHAVLAASRLLLRLGFRLGVRGLESLPRDRPFLVAANHQSHLDTFALIAALAGQVERVHVLGARDYFFDTRAKGWAFRNLLNVVAFDREKSFLEGLRMVRGLLRPGHAVLIFPEGTRSTTGHLQPFKVGLGILAVELGVAVVPARVRGSFEAWPKGRRLPRLRRLDVAFGPPVAAEPYRERRGQAPTYDLYRELVAEVRQRVEALIEEA